jgi:hypothetical protein
MTVIHDEIHNQHPTRPGHAHTNLNLRTHGLKTIKYKKLTEGDEYDIIHFVHVHLIQLIVVGRRWALPASYLSTSPFIKYTIYLIVAI